MLRWRGTEPVGCHGQLAHPCSCVGLHWRIRRQWHSVSVVLAHPRCRYAVREAGNSRWAVMDRFGRGISRCRIGSRRQEAVLQRNADLFQGVVLDLTHALLRNADDVADLLQSFRLRHEALGRRTQGETLADHRLLHSA